MIIALLNQKGGVGKTTLATHIAGELAMRGQQVVLLDADPQGSALDWTQRRAQQGLPRLFSAVGLARETLHQEAPELARRADHVVIDGPPRIAALARSALLAAERVLIPVQPSPYDLWASAEMVALIREAQVFRPTLRAAFAINRRVSTTIIGREARQGSDARRAVDDDVIGPACQLGRFLMQRLACEAHGAEQARQALLGAPLCPVQR